jgi:3-oxoacyl-[acyl-carrier protein] reductase
MSKNGKVAIVTGAGRGIGEATAQRLAADGAAVSVWDVNAEAAEAVAGAIREAGGNAIACAVDVSNKEQVDAAVAKTVEELGGLHILVNNAGITRDKSAKKLGEAEWDLVLAVNLKGTFLVCQAAMNVMLESGYGRIVNTASVAVDGNFGQANYSASKAGVVGLTRTLALECAKAGITVNCVAPGATDTPMFDAVPDEIKQAICKSIPLRRMAEPAEVASVHAFLTSDDASYVTGQLVYVDGGATLGV